MDVITLLGQLLGSTLVFSTALIFTSLGGIFSEKAGVVNIGLEGMMIFGAFAAGVGTYYAQDAGFGAAAPWIGILCAVIFGVIGSLIHALASVTFKADQTISGVVINFLAAGLTVYMVKLLFNGSAETPLINPFHKYAIPVLRDIPILGEGFFNAYPTSYLALIMVGIAFYVLYKTPFGLRLRSVGEYPGAADTLGINVSRMRYIGVMISGALAGLGGATLTLTTTSIFSHNTVSGQGFIAIAAMIFGKWNPVGAFGAAMFFGFSQAIRNYVQMFEWSSHIPQEFIFMIPYVLTIIVLVSAVGRSHAPAALGTPYDPSKR